MRISDWSSDVCSSDLYERVASECLGKLRSEFLGKRIEALGSYHAKASFGDCDILIESGPDYDPNQAAAALNPIEIVRNGPVTSVGVMVNPDARSTEGNVFQVDLIKTDPQEIGRASCRERVCQY